MKKYLKKENKGITLIALVITIIILLILAGVTINALLGDNGLFKRVEQAQKVALIENLKEELKLKIMTFQTNSFQEKIDQNLQNLKIFFDNDGEVETIEYDLNNNTLQVLYKEYIFTIDEKLNILDNVEKNTDLRTKVTFNGEKGLNNWYLTDVNIKISIANNSNKTYKISYKINEENKEVQNTMAEINVNSEGINNVSYKIYEDENVIKEDSFQIKINKKPPTATIKLSSYEVETGNSIPVTVNIEEDVSEINQDKTLWVLNKNKDKIGNDTSLYTGGKIEDLEQITSNEKGSYYLHCLITNNAGRVEEYVSDKIAFIQIVSLLEGTPDTNNTHDDITGGWISISSNSKSYFSYGSRGEFSELLTGWLAFATDSGAYSCGVTKNKINLTDIKEIVMDITYAGDGGTADRYYIGICDDEHKEKNLFTSENHIEENKPTKTLKSGRVTLDVSNIEGSFYIKALAERYMGRYFTTVMRINHIYLK